MNFFISIKFGGKNIRLKVEKIESTIETETFYIIARNKSFKLRGNKPLLIAKGLKHRKPNWKVIDGDFSRSSTILELIIKAIESKLKY
jgi:hypothetical protein